MKVKLQDSIKTWMEWILPMKFRRNRSMFSKIHSFENTPQAPIRMISLEKSQIFTTNAVLMSWFLITNYTVVAGTGIDLDRIMLKSRNG
jgi:hypothetical protein